LVAAAETSFEAGARDKETRHQFPSCFSFITRESGIPEIPKKNFIRMAGVNARHPKSVLKIAGYLTAIIVCATMHPRR
jgi:hypothetical protein